ncbi:MAG: Oligopeptide-binding protein AppA [Anaerolineae bacterium]|nr:Oligopeptide-binding protein AppA [Anaerolineae bacterium]
MKHRLLILMMLAALLALAACGGAAPPPTAAPEQPQESSQAAPTEAPAAEAPAAAATEAPATEAPAAAGGTVRIGWNGSPDTLNPGAALLEESFTLYEMAYDTIYDLQLDGSYTLTLADSVDISDDNTVYTFHIRDGVKFHDGTPMTAKDLAFSYNFYQQHEDFPYLNSYTGYFESVEAPDDKTLVLTLTEAIPNLESQLVFLYVLPEHIWSAVAEGDAAAEFANDQMIGTGPFKMVEYKQNEFVRMAANKDHFLTPPKVDEVVFQTFANPDALVQAVVTGQVDMITEMPKTAVPTLRNAENVKVVNGAPLSPNIRDIMFNVVDPDNCPAEDGVCSGHPALRDRTVRQALAHATDKQTMIDVALLGLGTPGLTLVADGLGVWYNKDLKDYDFNIATANQMLDDAGYKDADGDGVRDMPDGSRPLSFRLNWPNDISEAPRLADLLKDTWGQAGIKLEPQAFDPDALTSVCCPAFDYDVIMWGWGSDPDPAFLLSVMTTDEIPTGFSETGYSNPEFDKLYAEQATAADDEQRRQIIYEMQRIVLEDVPYIIPYYDQAVQAYRTDRFKGWIIDAPKLSLQDTTSLTVIEPVQ